MKATSYLPCEQTPHSASGRFTLAHHQRHLRRKLLVLPDGEEVLVDFPVAVVLQDGDALVLEDGRLIAIEAAPEDLYEVAGRDARHFARLCWHIGNRHLPAQIEAERLLIEQDHVIRHMLEGLGATVRQVRLPFAPEQGAYHGHSHSQGEGHSHAHG